MALFSVPSPVAFFRSLLSRKGATLPASPARFEGTIVVVSPPVRGALPKPALVTPYAGHRPTVTRGARGRFVSVRKAGALPVAINPKALVPSGVHGGAFGVDVVDALGARVCQSDRYLTATQAIRIARQRTDAAPKLATDARAAYLFVDGDLTWSRVLFLGTWRESFDYPQGDWLRALLDAGG